MLNDGVSISVWFQKLSWNIFANTWKQFVVRGATFGNQKVSSKQIKSMSDKTDTPEILAENLHKWITEIMKFKGYGSAKKCPTKEDLKRY